MKAHMGGAQQAAHGLGLQEHSRPRLLQPLMVGGSAVDVSGMHRGIHHGTLKHAPALGPPHPQPTEQRPGQPIHSLQG